MSKTESEGLKKIETSFLKKHEYFIGWKSGSIIWTDNYSGHKNDISIEVSTMNGDNYIRIYYTQTNRDNNEKKSFDYKIPLTTTPCNYGGKRYWFTCPWYKNGVYCGRRVGVLYKDGDYFACRHCYNLTYSSRNASGSFRRFGNVTMPDVDKAREKVKLTHYKGKPTRKYLRYLELERKLDDAFVGMALSINKKYKLNHSVV